MKNNDELIEKLNIVLTDYGYFNFKENTKSLLLFANKIEKKDQELGLFKDIIRSYNEYTRIENLDNLYITRDYLITLYNYLLQK